MDTLSNPATTEAEAPLTEAGQAALRDEVLRRLGSMPFSPGAPISRSLWLIFICPWGVQTRAVMPVDDRLDLPEPGNCAGLCDLIASIMEHPMESDETALVVLRRPGPADVSCADKYIFRAICESIADRKPASWAFYVTGPDGVQEVTEHQEITEHQEVTEHCVGLTSLSSSDTPARLRHGHRR
jgi:hypothetical protein